jgi:hypothetical protein
MESKYDCLIKDLIILSSEKEDQINLMDTSKGSSK